ncbi:MAG: NHLP family bacteriocin export ABC transporter peptidase/permease/ATPase, partial [Eggerthellaceae bacterium]|nr:NHLP family bacteriocin export ABC transporter peptidase/permease/ATPase [Eggerthellaceae bacterium]
LDGFRGKSAIINDPARGQVKIPLEQFDESFTGIVLLFEKTDAFEEGGTKPSPLRFARKRLEGLGWPIAFVMVSAAIAATVGILNTSLSQVFLDRILGGGDIDWLVPLLVIMLGLALISGAVSVLSAVYLLRIQGRIGVVSSSRFMRHLLHLPMGFYSQRMIGDLQQRQSANESIAFQLIGQLAPVLVNGAMLILYLVIMLNYSVLLTVVGLLTVVINAVLARYISTKRVNIARSSVMSAGKLYGTTVGGIEMIETIKASGAEVGYFGRWAGYQAAVNESGVRIIKLNEYMGMLPTLFTSVANIIVLVLGIWLIVQGSFTPGALLAFTGFLASFMSPVNQIINLGQTVQELSTQMERVEDVMNYPVDVPEERDD